MRSLLALCSVLLVAACASNPPPTIVHQPMSVRPDPVEPTRQANAGAIINLDPAAKRLALFEDRRATRVGDILTVLIEEKVSATSKADTSASHEGSVTLKGALDPIPLFPDKLEQIMAVDASVSNKQGHTGKGSTSSSNTFSGTITVTITEVLPNGNLLVSGEKQVAVNAETEYLRFSGVVNPDDVKAGNIISSLKVADARVEHRGAGSIARAQEPGWLGRFVQSILPF